MTLDLKASLRIAQRRFDEALSLLDQVAEIYRFGDPEHRDTHLAGRALIKKSHALVEKGEMERVIATLRETEALIDPQREPRLLYCLRHNLVDNLTKAARFVEAHPLLAGLWELAGPGARQPARSDAGPVGGRSNGGRVGRSPGGPTVARGGAARVAGRGDRL